MKKPCPRFVAVMRQRRKEITLAARAEFADRDTFIGTDSEKLCRNIQAALAAYDVEVRAESASRSIVRPRRTSHGGRQ